MEVSPRMGRARWTTLAQAQPQGQTRSFVSGPSETPARVLNADLQHPHTTIPTRHGPNFHPLAFSCTIPRRNPSPRPPHSFPSQNQHKPAKTSGSTLRLGSPGSFAPADALLPKPPPASCPHGPATSSTLRTQLFLNSFFFKKINQFFHYKHHGKSEPTHGPGYI